MSTIGTTRHVCTLSIFIAILTICFAVISILQFSWTNDLEEKYEENLRKLATLKTRCLQRGVKQQALFPVEDESDVHQRDVSGSLHDLLVQMMAVQEKIILSHCMNNSNLCIQGPKGDVGPRGPDGTAGYPGAIGSQGPAGPKGQIGSQGENGTKGEPGLPGHKGEKGTAGSGVGIVGPPGPLGSPGLNGTGEKGDQGPTGDTGLIGIRGYQGPPGPSGSSGFDGPKGDKGGAGMQGPKGPQGPNGKDGIQLDKDCLCIRKPVNITAPSIVYVSANVPLQLHCDPDVNNANAKVTWEVPNVTTCSSITPSGSVLSFKDFQPTREGLYNCTITSKNGSIKKIFDVRLTGDPLTCTFDDNSLCYWRADNNVMLTWSPRNGSTPTFDTGPDYDKTLGPNNAGCHKYFFYMAPGYYAYMESSYGRRGNTTAMTSPELPGTSSDMCFSFWYHMHGDDMGSLKVFVADIIQDINLGQNCGELYTLIGQKTGEQGKDWQYFSAQVPARQNLHRFIIEGVRGDGNFGDIAVDNIQSYSGPCSKI